MKLISIFVVLAAGACAPASAEDLTSGKTPAQLFRSDCSSCHPSPNALARDGDVRALAGFLRQHYTTKSETAAALAAFLSASASSATLVRSRRGARP